MLIRVWALAPVAGRGAIAGSSRGHGSAPRVAP